MTVFTVTVYMQNYTLTSKQSNKHILIVVKCLQLSTNICLIREVTVDVYGRRIILNGQHAFEWSITICTRERIVKTTYPNGKEARKEFYKYKRKK